MSRRLAPKAKWVLPQTINPPGRICFIVRVPNERFHIAAFLGAMQSLASGSQWEDDPQHLARLVAKVWRKVANSISRMDCEDIQPLTRQSSAESPEGMWRQNGCKLEFSIDGECWCTVYDPSDCIADSTSQPTGEGEIPEGECREFDATLQANGKWLLPVPVQGGYTIQITDAKGGASDGTAEWFCPSGQNYALGGCVGNPNAAEGTDPLPTGFHMRLTGESPDLGIFDAYNTTISVPADVTDLQDVQFFVNDSTRDDNSGSYTFHVKVCNNTAAVWCQEFDFEVSNHGWLIREVAGDSGPRGVYTPGVGFETVFWTNGGNAFQNSEIYIPVPSGTVTQIEMTYSHTAGAGTPNALGSAGNSARIWIGLTPEEIESPATPPTITWDGTLVAPEFRFDNWPGFMLASAVDPGGSGITTKARITGTGNNPFSTGVTCP